MNDDMRQSPSLRYVIYARYSTQPFEASQGQVSRATAPVNAGTTGTDHDLSAMLIGMMRTTAARDLGRRISRGKKLAAASRLAAQNDQTQKDKS